MYNILKRMIEQKNYETKIDLQNKLDTFYKNDKLTEDQYKELLSILSLIK